MSHPKHPLVAFHRSDTAPNLIGERLETQPIISGRKRAADGVTRSFSLLHAKKTVDRLLETTAQKQLVARERNQGTRFRRGCPAIAFQKRAGQMEPMEGIEKE